MALFNLIPTNEVAVTNSQLFDVAGWVLSVAGCFPVTVFGVAQTSTAFSSLPINHGREYSKKSLLF